MRTALLTVPLGLSAGSVIGAAATRWPAGLGLGRPARSRCEHCGRSLRRSELVPVLSWLVLGGRCRGCARPIGPVPPVVESGTAILVAAAMVPPYGVALLLAGVGGVLLLATVLDLTHRWIPDRLTLPSGAVVLPAALALSIGADGTASPRSVLLIGLGIPVLMSGLRAVATSRDGRAWLGGGDVKLLVPVLAAAAVVPGGSALVGLGSVASGGVVAAVGLATGRLARGSTLPFAPFLLAGWALLLLARRGTVG